jgi:hypothetical protein
MVRTWLVVVCLMACSNDKDGADPCSEGIGFETVALPAWFAVEDAGTVAFEAGKKPVFSPTQGASQAQRFGEMWEEQMKGDGAISISFERVSGSKRHHCGTMLRVGEPGYPQAVVTYFQYERGSFKFTKLDRAPAPATPPTPADPAGSGSGSGSANP